VIVDVASPKQKQRGITLLRPRGDSVPWRTWRNESVDELRRRGAHFYPKPGCHGAPLERECPCMIEWVKGTKHKAAGCDLCNGSGRIRLDAPNRRNVP
jgi:hypothetical protein